MRTLVIILALTSVAFAGTTVYFARELTGRAPAAVMRRRRPFAMTVSAPPGGQQNRSQNHGCDDRASLRGSSVAFLSGAIVNGVPAADTT